MFPVNTPFITDKGIKTFKDFRVGEVVNVMDKDGIWRSATIQAYGNRQIQRITFQRDDIIKQIECAVYHKWMLDFGYVTKQITTGHKLYQFCNGMPYHISNVKRKYKDYVYDGKYAEDLLEEYVLLNGHIPDDYAISYLVADGRHITSHKPIRSLYWTVVSVRKLNREEEVWCVEEPESHSFCLSDHVVARAAE